MFADVYRRFWTKNSALKCRTWLANRFSDELLTNIPDRLHWLRRRNTWVALASISYRSPHAITFNYRVWSRYRKWLFVLATPRPITSANSYQSNCHVKKSALKHALTRFVLIVKLWYTQKTGYWTLNVRRWCHGKFWDIFLRLSAVSRCVSLPLLVKL